MAMAAAAGGTHIKLPRPRRMTILDLGHACDDARYGHIVARRIAGEEEEEEEGLGRDGKLNGAFVMGVDSALDVFEREGKQVAHF